MRKYFPNTSLTRANAQKKCITAGLLTVSLLITGCYVVPVPQGGELGRNAAKRHAAQLANGGSTRLSGRMYPSNQRANAYGVGTASIVRERANHAVFTANLSGKTFTGEATRSASHPKQGTANGTSSDGLYLNCQYEMNTAVRGSGTCRVSDGATFSIHIGT